MKNIKLKMNKLTLYFALFGIFLNFCSSQVIYVKDALHEDHPDKCYHEPTKHFFSPGESYNPIGTCAVLHCSEPGQYSGRSCGIAIISECKKLGSDLTKPHPFCCPRFLCIDKDGKEYIVNPSIPIP